MNRNEKKQFIDSLKTRLESASLIVLSRQSGLTVAEATLLRRKMRESGASFKVVKNTLTKIALQGLPCEAIAQHCHGPVAISCSQDPIMAAKVLGKYVKENKKIEIVCGSLNGVFLDSQAVLQLAELPSMDELRGKVIGLLQAPAGALARILQAPASKLTRVFSAYSSK